MLEMRGISKRFGYVRALKQANITVQKAEIMALLGANGSGKSTMMKVLGGLIRADEGSIFLNGEEIRIERSNDVHKYKIAIGLQDLSLIPTLSVMDNILLGIEPRKGLFVDKKEASERIGPILSRLGITYDPSVLVSDLAPSEQSMVEIAKAIARDPDILVLDEVTASLHSHEVDLVFEELKRLKAQGKAIVIVTHRMGEVFRVCDRCTILKGGETVAADAVENFDLDDIIFHMTGRRPEAVCQDEEDQIQIHADKVPVIETRRITVVPTLKGVNFRAFQGEIVGIGGLNGQGQSEFIRSMLGDLPIDEGEMFYQGEAVRFRMPVEAVNRGIGFISGDRNRESIFPLRSVGENIFAAEATQGRWFSHLSPKTIAQYAKRVIDEYDIVAGSTKHLANSLSGGNQQKLIIGRWLSMKPALLLLDDPTKGVDIHSRREIHRILRDAAREGMCVVYASSDNEELLEIADRIYIFYEGTSSRVLSGDDRTEEKLVAAMLDVRASACPKGENS